MSKLHIKKGDKVKVIAGNGRGKISTVLQVLPAENKAIVEDTNLVTKHVKPTSANPNGSIEKKAMPIHISNIMIYDATLSQATRVGRRINEKGKSERYSKKSNTTIA
ncbi:MAG: 50S ribosomal protein L24 [Cytophagales bacterium]|nr:50S ribosomal protein L24 [Cytophagales bacterium]